MSYVRPIVWHVNKEIFKWWNCVFKIVSIKYELLFIITLQFVSKKSIPKYLWIKIKQLNFAESAESVNKSYYITYWKITQLIHCCPCCIGE